MRTPTARHAHHRTAPSITVRTIGADAPHQACATGGGLLYHAPPDRDLVGGRSSRAIFGSGGLLAANAPRVAAQQGVAVSTLAKTVLTGATLAATAYSRVLGKKIELAASADPQDAEKAAKHPIDTDKAQRHLACMQWAVPALTGTLVTLNALHGEQQRPTEQVHGMWQRARSLAPHMAMPSAPD
ncbi:hypothetical protein ABT033_28100 [Streptomyces pharetrae]|uniref:hypothetical protein n=1 Tax=Streptomyces pharetrae TaxID=291370 RepID=UPI0033501FFC